MRQNPSSAKVTVIFAHDSAGIILTHAVPQHRTVTGHYYADFLEHHLRRALRKKRPHFLGDNTPIILHDNARPHVADVVSQLMARWQWEVLYHPPYSPDISPCDFDLIPKVKEPLRGRRFKTIPDIIDAVGRSVRTINKTGAATGTMRLPHPWERVLHNVGEYIEGLRKYELCSYCSVAKIKIPTLVYVRIYIHSVQCCIKQCGYYSYNLIYSIHSSTIKYSCVRREHTLLSS